MSDIYRAWSYNDAALYHHGIKGMKWGVRRYQNPDGTLTAQGHLHYSQEFQKESGKARKYDYKRKKKLSKASAMTSRRKQKNQAAREKYGGDAIPERVKNRLARYDARTNKAVAKAEKAENKYRKQISKMRKKFANVKVTDIDPKVYDRGKAYATMLMGYGSQEPYITYDSIDGWTMGWDGNGYYDVMYNYGRG